MYINLLLLSCNLIHLNSKFLTIIIHIHTYRYNTHTHRFSKLWRTCEKTFCYYPHCMHCVRIIFEKMVAESKIVECLCLIFRTSFKDFQLLFVYNMRFSHIYLTNIYVFISTSLEILKIFQFSWRNLFVDLITLCA